MKKFRGIFLKNENEINLLREANRIGSLILDAMCAEAKPGVPTMLFEEIAQDMCRAFNVRPAFQGYMGFPFAICCSVNEEVVHGFPSNKRILNDGDIVSFDMGVVYEGFNGDSARTVTIGNVSSQIEKLVKVTEASLYKGIEVAVLGNSIYDISAAVQKCAEDNELAVIRRFVGHGVGRNLHEKPEIPNFVPTSIFPSIPLRVGMVLAIEPMLALGTYEVDILSDSWTAVTRDRKYSAHFEHSIAITSNGPLILSRSETV